jgi:hypothetical protein
MLLGLVKRPGLEPGDTTVLKSMICFCPPWKVHVDGSPAGPFEEMSRNDHRGPGNDKKNHPWKGKDPSRINRELFRRWVERYWKQEWDRGRFKVPE